MEDTPPNEAMLRAAEHYRKSLDERYENISARIAQRIDKTWLLATCSSEDAILEECVRLCEEVENHE